MTSSDSVHESSTELDLLQRGDCLFDEQTHVGEVTSPGCSDLSDNVINALDEIWSLRENETTENTNETIENCRGVNHAPATEHNNALIYDGAVNHASVTEHNNAQVINGGAVNHVPVTEHSNALINVEVACENYSTKAIIDSSYTLNNYEDSGDEKICKQDTLQDFSSDDASESDSMQDFSSDDASESDSMQDFSSDDASESDSMQDFSSDDASDFDSMQDSSSHDASESDSMQDFSSDDASDFDSMQDFNSDDASDSDSTQDFSSDDANDSDSLQISMQDFSSDDANDSDSIQDSSSSKEGHTTPDLTDVFNKLYEVYTEFKDVNQRDQLLTNPSERVIAIGRNIRKWFKEALCDDCEQPQGAESVNSQDAHCGASSNLHFYGIVKGLLELFTRENSSEKGGSTRDSVREKEADVETEQFVWTDAICDVIRELVDFWCKLYANEDNAMNMGMKSEQKDMTGAEAADSSGHNAGNTHNKKHTITGMLKVTDAVKELVLVPLKTWLWIFCGCKVVAAESTEADDVLYCSNGTSSIIDCLSYYCQYQNASFHETMRWLWKAFYWGVDHVTNKSLILMMKFADGRAINSSSLIRKISKLIHWLNDNSCRFTNFEWTDTGTKQPIEVIVSCLISWAYSILMTSDVFGNSKWLIEMNLFYQLCNVDAICLVFLATTSWIFHMDLLFDDQETKLKSIGAISPHCECFLSHLVHILLYWVLYFFSQKLSFAEKTCTFGKKLVKEVSVLELLCFMNEDKQPTPSKFAELQQIVKKLSEEFQVENISIVSVQPEFHIEQQNDSVVTQTDTSDECETVVDLLWSMHQDTLSQSNWCNAFVDVTKMIDMLVNDLRNLVFPKFDFNTSGFTPILSGSRLDGCVSMLSGPGNACDFDLMDPILKCNNLRMECVPGRPANVVFKIGSDSYYNSVELFENGYLSPKSFKKYLIFTSHIFLFPSMLLFSPCHRRFNTAISLQCGNVASTYFVFQGEEVIFSLDYVLAMSIDTWPDQAQNWIHKNTAWPVSDTREAIARTGCHAVPKTTKGGDPNREWRFSFSKAENTICKMFNPSQVFHLSLLKTQFQSVKSIGSSEDRIFKNYIIKKGEFHTYHAKTTMFWFCESHPPEHEIWRKENVYQCQSELLESMEGMMREGNIPHYFIPEQNLLVDIPEELLVQAVAELIILKEQARTKSGRVYQEIIKQTHEKDSFSKYLSDIWCLWSNHFYNSAKLNS